MEKFMLKPVDLPKGRYSNVRTRNWDDMPIELTKLILGVHKDAYKKAGWKYYPDMGISYRRFDDVFDKPYRDERGDGWVFYHMEVEFNIEGMTNEIFEEEASKLAINGTLWEDNPGWESKIWITPYRPMVGNHHLFLNIQIRGFLNK